MHYNIPVHVNLLILQIDSTVDRMSMIFSNPADMWYFLSCGVLTDRSKGHGFESWMIDVSACDDVLIVND